MNHQDQLRIQNALAILQSPELLMREAINNGQSIPATRLAYEKIAAGIPDPQEGKNFRKDVTAAEDTFRPIWMRQEGDGTDQRRQRAQNVSSPSFLPNKAV